MKVKISLTFGGDEPRHRDASGGSAGGRSCLPHLNGTGTAHGRGFTGGVGEPLWAPLSLVFFCRIIRCRNDYDGSYRISSDEL